MDYKKLIVGRKSVRNYKKNTLKVEQIEELKSFFYDSKKLVKDIDTEIIFYDNKIFDKLNGKVGYRGFMIDAPAYALLLSEKKDFYRENIGYIGEHFILKAESLKIDSCWLIVEDSDLVKDILDIDSTREVVALIALGYDNNKTKMINIPKIGANESKSKLARVEDNVSDRLAVEEIVYFKNWGQNADIDTLENRALLDAFHYAGLAPSAVNKQPWRFVLDDDIIVLTVKTDETDINKIDAGIIMLHFEVVADKTYVDIEWKLEKADRNFNIPSDYVVIGYCKI